MISTRGVEAIASMAASTSVRDTLRAVSSTLTWSAASAVSNSLWSRENSGAAEVAPCAAGAACMRRYSSRAAPCSSGKPSKPSACEKRTTVDEDVEARRASSSAVWKATSSRWSTTYCATSFCERENSSKREEMYADRVWCPEAEGGIAAVFGIAQRGFAHPCAYPPRGFHGATRNTHSGPQALRAHRPRRRARLLRGDVPRRNLGHRRG